MPDWLFALLMLLGVMVLAVLAGWALFSIFFAPLYRRKDRP